VPILLFFGYCLVSAIWSDYPDVSAKRWVKDLGDLLMVMVMLTDPNPLAALKRLLTRVGLLLATFSILFVKYFPTLGRNYSPWTGEAFYTGVTTNKQGLGMIMLIFGLGAIWQLVFLYRAKEAPHRWRHMLVQAVLFGEVMWLSRRAQSMTSMATFFMVGFMVLLIGLYQWARKPMFVHFYVASATFVTVLALFLSPSSGLVEKLGRNSTLTGRTEIWNLVLNMPINRLLGTGFESFWLGDRLQYIWNLYWWHPNEAHNGYIEILLNLGWIGLALLAIIMVSGYAKVARRLRSDAEVNSIRLAYLFVALIYAFTEAAFRMLTFTWVFLLFAAATGVEAIDPTAQMLPATERPLKPPQIANVEHPVWLGRRRSI
jgi:O-antigen ligase